MATEPTIPLRHSELLHVALSVITQEIEKRTDYDTHNMHRILDEYRASRDAYVATRGWRAERIAEITEGAIDGLNQWLDERADQSEHLELWEKEFE